MLTIDPSRSRWRWPWSGRMFVVVAGTIVAPCGESTRWTVEPWTTSPSVGETMASFAVLLGRGAGVEGGPVAAWPLGGAPSRTAHAMTAAITPYSLPRLRDR